VGESGTADDPIGGVDAHLLQEDRHDRGDGHTGHYRAALGIDAALTQIADGRSAKFDPDVVDVTLDLFHTRRIGLDP
jgi:hypothetical protein